MTKDWQLERTTSKNTTLYSKVSIAATSKAPDVSSAFRFTWFISQLAIIGPAPPHDVETPSHVIATRLFSGKSQLGSVSLVARCSRTVDGLFWCLSRL